MGLRCPNMQCAGSGLNRTGKIIRLQYRCGPTRPKFPLRASILGQNIIEFDKWGKLNLASLHNAFDQKPFRRLPGRIRNRKGSLKSLSFP
jgi:hypothetical protein